MWVDQKVLKLIVYLLNYPTELYQMYIDYEATISWFDNGDLMTQ